MKYIRGENMNYLMSLHWLHKSILVCGFLIIFNLIFPIFAKNNVRPEVVLCYWYLGAIIGISLSFWKLEMFEVKDLYTPAIPLLIIFVIGVIIGTPANILFGQAMADPSCPNPGIAFTIMNSAGAFAYIIGPALAMALPKVFDKMKFVPTDFLGLVLIVSGIGIIALSSR
jgi:hypothetical protein